MAIEWKKLAYEADVITKALLTKKGSIIYASAAGTPAELLIGNNGQVLSVDASLPSWADGAYRGEIPFYTEDGALNVVELVNNKIPFYDELSTEKNIPLI